jgi:hypothetical protein
VGGEEGSASVRGRGTGIRGREQAGRKLQHVFSTETRCGPLSAGASRIHPHRVTVSSRQQHRRQTRRSAWECARQGRGGLPCSESPAGVAQLAEQPSCKRQVSGSIPLTGSAPAWVFGTPALRCSPQAEPPRPRDLAPMSQRPEPMVPGICVMLGVGDRDYGAVRWVFSFAGCWPAESAS